MPRFIADLHIHSRYSIATSQDMGVAEVAKWARRKGIALMGTGDFTHPKYRQEIAAALQEDGHGLLLPKDGDGSVRFVLSTELSAVYAQGGKTRKVHLLVYVPTLVGADAIIRALQVRGRLDADGRPTFALSACDLTRVILDACPDAMVIPAHAWTPWFSVFGANSGFDSLEECFQDMTPHIKAIETGLSSDPAMNWRLCKLDHITLVSNSDAHSPSRIGREANVFDCELDYFRLKEVIETGDRQRFLMTIEFFPEEGKYHFDGHRRCGVVFSPEETKRHGGLCPVCGRQLTIGVMHRVDELADRPPGFVPANAVPAVHLIPLQEIIAEALGQGVDTVGVQNEYLRLVAEAGSEFCLLLDLEERQLASFVPERILTGIMRVRQGKLYIVPGHDGEFGKIEIFADDEQQGQEQLSLF
ncbi:MAG: endonuclease Q family protein [bacterium]|nr:endonuclease Q family protein [candidate division KSB1 bacterium]MDH7560448.1 endonuclease Q family protein [bacterium]